MNVSKLAETVMVTIETVFFSLCRAYIGYGVSVSKWDFIWGWGVGVILGAVH